MSALGQKLLFSSIKLKAPSPCFHLLSGQKFTHLPLVMLVPVRFFPSLSSIVREKATTAFLPRARAPSHRRCSLALLDRRGSHLPLRPVAALWQTLLPLPPLRPRADLASHARRGSSPCPGGGHGPAAPLLLQASSDPQWTLLLPL
jgi:hypothetical protein